MSILCRVFSVIFAVNDSGFPKRGTQRLFDALGASQSPKLVLGGGLNTLIVRLSSLENFSIMDQLSYRIFLQQGNWPTVSRRCSVCLSKRGSMGPNFSQMSELGSDMAQ